MSSGPRRPGRPVSRVSACVAAVSLACIVGWAVPALLMLDKGFSVQDEGSYVLSYRYWHTNPYFESGSQYLLGPVFEAMGESIPLLRALRLVALVAANAWFAWSFLTWLEQRPGASLPASRASLVLLLTAAGGMSYLWSPLTPGYYDLAAVSTLSLTALLFHALTRAPSPPWWVPAVSGVLAVALLVTKWTAFLTVVVLVVVAVRALGPDRPQRLRYLAGFGIGLVLSLVAFSTYAVPLPRFVEILWQVSGLTASENHGVRYLVVHGVESTAQLLLAAAVEGWPLALGLVGARAAGRRGHSRTALQCLFAGAAVTLLVPFLVGWRGGGDRGLAVLGVAFLGLLVAGAVAGSSTGQQRRAGEADRGVVVVLLLVPFLQAAGSNVSPLVVGGVCLALWVALVVMLLAHRDTSPLRTTAVLVNLGVAMVATALLAGTSTLLTPFQSAGLTADTVSVPELGIKLSASAARRDAALSHALRPYVVPRVTPVLTLDAMAGVTYLVGGVPAGSTWTDPLSYPRTAGILALACRYGDVRAARPPVLVVDRPVDAGLARAMAGCGFPFPGSYRRASPPGLPRGLHVYIPRTRS